jgi:iron complex transport system ATP-binding protein
VNNLLSAIGLGFQINNKQLLQDASLDIKPGEVTVILGPNGAGKSTFMKLLCGDLSSSTGFITLDGNSAQSIDRRSMAQRRAMMPQSSNVVFPFSVYEIVMMGRSPYVSGSETLHDQQIVKTAMQCTGVSDLVVRNYNTLSGGEQQRVQLARVLTQIWSDGNGVNEAAGYLLLDEPVASMDLAHQHETLRIAKQFAQRNVGVLIILHDINLAAMYADRIAIFQSGKIVRQGKPTDVFDQELISDVFGIEVLLSEHPTLGCPLMVSLPKPISHSTNQIDNYHAGVA